MINENNALTFAEGTDLVDFTKQLAGGLETRAPKARIIRLCKTVESFKLLHDEKGIKGGYMIEIPKTDGSSKTQYEMFCGEEGFTMHILVATRYSFATEADAKRPDLRKVYTPEFHASFLRNDDIIPVFEGETQVDEGTVTEMSEKYNLRKSQVIYGYVPQFDEICKLKLGGASIWNTDYSGGYGGFYRSVLAKAEFPIFVFPVKVLSENYIITLPDGKKANSKLARFELGTEIADGDLFEKLKNHLLDLVTFLSERDTAMKAKAKQGDVTAILTSGDLDDGEPIVTADDIMI